MGQGRLLYGICRQCRLGFVRDLTHSRHGVQHVAGARQQPVTGRQELYASCRTTKQGHAELVFESADLTAQRWLRDVQAPSGAADVAFFGDSHKVSELIQAHAPSLARGRMGGAIPKRYWRYGRRSGQGGRVSIELFGPETYPALRRAGRVAAATLRHVAGRLRAGVSSAQIDAWVREDTKQRGGRPSQLNYRATPDTPPFPGAVCVSIDDVVCHGIPRASTRLAPGQIVNVDVTTEIGGFHGDTSQTFIIGEASAEARHVVDVARRCLDAGIRVVRPGARLGDIGAAIEEIAEREGCSVVRDFGGHGVGRAMHCEPHVPHHGRRGTGMRLKAGMVFTIEPMINLGSPDVECEADGWTVRTRDGSLSAQFEHTLLVTCDGVEILTRTDPEGSPG
jgi:methionyl aminopeptidase